MKISGVKRIAERYVRALFDVAEADGALAQVEKDLETLQVALSKSQEFRDFLINPLLSRENQAEAMEAILGKIRAGDTTRQFIAMLARHRRLAALPEITALFADWSARVRGEVKAQVIAASPLKTKDVTTLGERLSDVYGRKVHLEVSEDTSLLGGMIIKIGSQQLDGSLAGKLQRLQLALKAA